MSLPRGGGDVPPNIGKMFVFGGTIVLAGLSGLYISMLRNKHKQERLGTNPMYEQVIAHVNTKPLNTEDFNSLSSRSANVRAQPMTPPTKEHNAKHITLDDYKASSGSDNSGRHQVPSPQRARGDDSGWVYTKSPDYVRNYKRTKSTRVEEDQTGRGHM